MTKKDKQQFDISVISNAFMLKDKQLDISNISYTFNMLKVSFANMVSAAAKTTATMKNMSTQLQHIIDRKDAYRFYTQWAYLTGYCEHKDHITNWRVIPRPGNLSNSAAHDMWISLYVSPPRSEWMNPDVDPKFFIQLVKFHRNTLPGPFEIKEDGFYDQDEKSANYIIDRYLTGHTHARDVFEKCRQTINGILKGDYAKEKP